MSLTYPSMPGAAGRALDRRKASILRAIVREYVKSGQPVASKTLVERYKLQVSAATIRNDMGVLEELGYIVQPHTSAGRIPTDLGYRWFVDNWPGMSWPEVSQEDRRAIDVVLDAEFRSLDYTLDSTSQVLSSLTEAAGIAMAPPSRRNKLRRLDLIMRDPKRATMLLVARNGEVEQGVVEFPEEQTEDKLDDLAKLLNAKLDGIDFTALAQTIAAIENVTPEMMALADEIDDVIEAGASQRIFRGGTANMLSPPVLLGHGDRPGDRRRSGAPPGAVGPDDRGQRLGDGAGLHRPGSSGRADAGLHGDLRPVRSGRRPSGQRRCDRADPDGLPAHHRCRRGGCPPSERLTRKRRLI